MVSVSFWFNFKRCFSRVSRSFWSCLCKVVFSVMVVMRASFRVVRRAFSERRVVFFRVDSWVSEV